MGLSLLKQVDTGAPIRVPHLHGAMDQRGRSGKKEPGAVAAARVVISNGDSPCQYKQCTRMAGRVGWRP